MQYINYECYVMNRDVDEVISEAIESSMEEPEPNNTKSTEARVAK